MQEELKQDREVVEVQSSTADLTTKVASLQVKDERSSKFATDLLSFIKKAYKKLEDRRKFFVGPLNEHVRDINLEFACMTEPLKEAETTIKEKLLSYHKILQAEQEKKRIEEQAKVDAMAKDCGLPPIEVAPPEAKTQIQGSMGKSYIQHTWTFDIVDFDKVPTKYKALDAVAVRNDIRAGVREIPGLRIFQKDTLASR